MTFLGQQKLGTHGHARWVRISHWIADREPADARVQRRRHPDGAPAALLGRRRERPHAGAPRAADQPQLQARRLGRSRRRSSRAPPVRSAPAGPTTSSTRTAGAAACTSSPRGASSLPGLVYLLTGVFGGHFRAHLWPRRSELAPRRVWRDVVDHLRLRIPPATGGPQYGVLQKCAYSFVVFVAAPLMVADRPDDVAGGDRGVSVAAAAVRRLPVGAHDPFLHVRRARAVRRRARRDGRQVRIPAADAGP